MPLNVILKSALAFGGYMSSIAGVGGLGIVLAPQMRTLPSNIDYYMTTTGSDGAACSIGSPCQTLGHVLSLVPQTLVNRYTVHVADGTYSEGIDTGGFIGVGSIHGVGPYSTSLTILGNLGTPANVVFSGGAIQCDGAFLAGACISGTGFIVLEGLTLSTGSRNGITCYNGFVQYNSVRVVMTGGASAASVGISNLGCEWDVAGNLTVSGFDTNTSPTGGLGIYNAHRTVGTVTGGTITITGPGGATADGTVCFVEEYAPTGFSLLGSSTNFTATGCGIGILINDNCTFTSYASSGTISLTNASTPSASTGINTSGGGAFNVAGAALTLTNWTTCILAAGNSVVDQGGASRTLTGCGTQTSAVQGSQIILF